MQKIWFYCLIVLACTTHSWAQAPAASKENTTRAFFKNGFFIDAIGNVGQQMVTMPYSGSESKLTPYPTPAIEEKLTLAQTVAGASLALGNRWHLGKWERFRFNVQVVWGRVGFFAPIAEPVTNIIGDVSTLEPVMTLTPANLGGGFSIALGKGKNMGIEVNCVVGFNTNLSFLPPTGTIAYNQMHVQLGYLVNPTIKFRYKSVSIGFDISYAYMKKGTLSEIGEHPVPVPYEGDAEILLLGLSIGGNF